MDLNSLAPIAVAFLVVGVMAGIGSEILNDVQQDVLTTATNTNDTINFASNNTAYALTNPTLTSLTSVSNKTDIISNTNFVAEGHQITLQANATHRVGIYNVTYVYEVHDAPYAATQNATLGVAKIATWLPTIGLVVAAGIIIGVLWKNFYSGKV